MRMLLLGVLSAAITLSAPAPPQRAATSLSGRVITGAGTDAKPVRRAKVTLTGGGLAAPRIADSDTTGAFRFDRVPAGALKLHVEKPGFVPLDADAAPGATLTMTRGGAIEGIVADANGDPVWNVVVAALQPQGDGAPKTIARTRTDDTGRYRLFGVPSGDYLVSASTDRDTLIRMFLMPGEKRPDANTAFYPAAVAMADARPVRVSSGRDSTAVDITLTPASPVKDPAAPPQLPRPDATGTGRIAGVVTDAASGKPVRDAELLLLPAPGQGPRLTNWTRTDRQGRFEYTSLAAQRYTLEFRGRRYVPLEYGQKRPGDNPVVIPLKDGEDYRADMKLPRASAIEGTLLDEFGDPAPSVTVQIAQRGYVGGRQRLVPLTAIATPPSDDRGHFRVASVPPGDYYIAALSGVYTDANEVGGFAPTYYPGTADSGGATPVTVAFGADTTALTFALVPARTYSIAGTMLDPEGKPVSGRGTIWLMTPDRLQRADFNLARGATAPDGTFLLRNVPQGMYTLQGFAPPPPDYRGPGNLNAFPFGWLPLAVDDGNLEGAVLKTSNGAALRGRIVFDDTTAAPPKAAQIRVDTLPLEWDSAPVGGGPSPSTTTDDYTFEVLRQNGLRRILASVQAPGWMLKKITLNGQDVTDTAVDLRGKDVEGVEITLTPKVTHVTGAATGDKGPIADYVVVIFASDPAKWTDRSRFVVAARPQQGRFTLNGLPPEDYFAIALPSVSSTELFDPDFLQGLRVLATSFTIGEGETKTLSLKLRTRP